MLEVGQIFMADTTGIGVWAFFLASTRLNKEMIKPVKKILGANVLTQKCFKTANFDEFNGERVSRFSEYKVLNYAIDNVFSLFPHKLQTLKFKLYK